VAAADRAPRAGPATPAFAGANAKIAIGSKREGHYEIFVMNPDGTGQINLTNTIGVDAHPAWSPEGSKIAFASTRNRRNEIFVMNADGSGVEQLTLNHTLDSEPAWSPDGSRIAFRSKRDGNDEIYVMNADGSGETNLTDDPDIDAEAAWSPDGSRIAFQSSRDGDFEIYLMDPDGSDIQQLTTNSASDTEAAWSPDGARIVFVSNRDGFAGEIYVMSADGTNPTRLTAEAALDDSPVWSPDGTKIAFVSERDGGDREIYTMDVDGAGVARLTVVPGEDGMPDWGALPAGGAPVAVADFAFDPATVSVARGATVRWEFEGPGHHTITDTGGMGLFGSGSQPPGGAYAAPLAGGGQYAYACSIHPDMTGRVRVPVDVRPTSGNEETRFLVTWAASPALPGFVYDVQVQRPGSRFQDWLPGEVMAEATFYADAGGGRYAFRARVRSLSTGGSSGYSRPAVISVL
jgi:TolB protein